MGVVIVSSLYCGLVIFIYLSLRWAVCVGSFRIARLGDFVLFPIYKLYFC